MKSFRVRGPDRRQQNAPVPADRRRTPRRFEDEPGEVPAGEVTVQLASALDTLAATVEERLARIEGRLSMVPARDDGEVTQIPTRNPHLRDSMTSLASLETEVTELVRKLRARGPLPGTDRKRILALVQRIMGVDRGMADLMARRLGRPSDAPETRGTRFLQKIEKLIA